MKTEQQEKFLKITKQSTIPFVAAGIASDVAGHVISEDGAIAMIEAVEAGEASQAALAGVKTELVTAKADLATAQSSLTDVKTELATAKTDLATAQSSLTDVKTELATAKTDLADAQAKITKLEGSDGGRFSGAGGGKPDEEAKLDEAFLMEEDKIVAGFMAK